jgi:hypothetical protein
VAVHARVDEEDALDCSVGKRDGGASGWIDCRCHCLCVGTTEEGAGR